MSISAHEFYGFSNFSASLLRQQGCLSLTSAGTPNKHDIRAPMDFKNLCGTATHSACNAH